MVAAESSSNRGELAGGVQLTAMETAIGSVLREVRQGVAATDEEEGGEERRQRRSRWCWRQSRSE